MKLAAARWLPPCRAEAGFSLRSACSLCSSVAGICVCFQSSLARTSVAASQLSMNLCAAQTLLLPRVATAQLMAPKDTCSKTTMLKIQLWGVGQFASQGASLDECCQACQEDETCDAWNFLAPSINPSTYCFFIKSNDCLYDTYTDSVYTFSTGLFYHGTGGLGAASRCNAATGRLDPHFMLHRRNASFTFDFHGKPDHAYCMVSDNRLQLNVLMAGLEPGAKVIQRPKADVEPFFEGTWMSGYGILYADANGQQHNITVVLDRALDRANKYPFQITCDGDTLPTLIELNVDSTWTSADRLATISLKAGALNSLLVTIRDVLEMEITTDFEREVVAEPPVHFLNFNILKVATSASVHGFLGQMMAPGAIDERLAMGTLEGLLHREYVEGVDEDYTTTDLTTANCAFNRFGQGPAQGELSMSTAEGEDSSSRQIAPSRRMLVAVPALSTSNVVESRCRQIKGSTTFTCA